MRAFLVALLILAPLSADAQVVGGSSNIAHIYRDMSVAVSIPSIAPNSAVLVTTSAPGIQPGDNAEISLAAGSAAPPANITIGAVFCTTAGTLSIKYANESGALTQNSAAINITVDVLIASIY